MSRRETIEYKEAFNTFERELTMGTKRALEDAGRIALTAVRAAPSDYNIGSILAKVQKTGIEHTSKGLGLWLIARDWRSIFFEKGTYTRRKGALKQPRRSARANRGVKAAHFLGHATKVARLALPALLRSHYGRIRVL